MIEGEVSGSVPAASGKLLNGQFDYSKERQKIPNQGPIPEGNYWINPAELDDNTWNPFVSYDSWGNFRITIHPFTNTETFGRGGFFIHGGSTAGSAGCIDLIGSMDAFASFLKQYKNCKIQLKVSYPVITDLLPPLSNYT